MEDQQQQHNQEFMPDRVATRTDTVHRQGNASKFNNQTTLGL
jgi:hypothetical protein